MSSDSDDQQPRGEVAYRKLLAAIQHGELKPGTRIREVEVAEKFDISRTPVRDAIRRLESDGLLIHVPRQGAVIKELDHREVIELYEIREVLEGTAARYAARHASELEIAELEDLNELMLKNGSDQIKVAEINRLFHQALYRMGNNRYLIDALNSLSNAMALLGGTTLQYDGRPQSAYDEHRDIVENIRAGNGDGADAAARLHIRNAQRLRIRLLRNVQQSGLEPAP
ncbi:GntR family transcriptional regulator [Thalassospira marina]|uniref:GntR family transcriptional regulator n=1 Tax=Thalassospira marina TaxID=2048283 RepID=A0A2N3KQZ9_9PROT|nr:GntR family transcriptional regulator [Thalassospira marina]PKR52989.1 GntR family transcriptional regulator [Thalassospira marina]